MRKLNPAHVMVFLFALLASAATRAQSCATCEIPCPDCCGDGICAGDEDCLICPEDCGDCCGNGFCDPGEDCLSCDFDCGMCCGNGTCDAAYAEDCQSCPTDCFGATCCGDGVCGLDEDCQTCSQDCGNCCGNGSCEAQFLEDCGNCAVDCGNCCGNGICEAEQTEDCTSCPQDCTACCGNTLCEGIQGEDCTSCPTDCGCCDEDFDGYCSDVDCAPSDGNAWELPWAVTNLVATKATGWPPGTVDLTWSAPGSYGGTSVQYTIKKSAAADSGFAAAAFGIVDTQFTLNDGVPAPGACSYLLVVATHGCGEGP